MAKDGCAINFGLLFTLGNATAYKSRFVIKGNEQVCNESDDYFAQVCNRKTLLVVIALAAHLNLELRQADFNTAFLNALINSDKLVFGLLRQMVPKNFTPNCFNQY